MSTSVGTTTYGVLVSTDLGGDPDDVQSLVHLLHYSDILKIEGLLSTTGPGSTPRAELVREWVRRVDLDYLRARGYPELMSEAEILPLVKQGATAAGAPRPGADTEGSRWLVERANASDPEGKGRPLWVLVWGSLTDVAQALHDDPGIAGKIRIYCIGSSNTIHDPGSRDHVYRGMKDNADDLSRWPHLWWIENGILPRFSHDTFQRNTRTTTPTWMLRRRSARPPSASGGWIPLATGRSVGCATDRSLRDKGSHGDHDQGCFPT